MPIQNRLTAGKAMRSGGSRFSHRGTAGIACCATSWRAWTLSFREMSGRADRYRRALDAGQIRYRIIDAQTIWPDTVMPAYYRTDGLRQVGRGLQGRSGAQRSGDRRPGRLSGNADRLMQTRHEKQTRQLADAPRHSGFDSRIDGCGLFSCPGRIREPGRCGSGHSRPLRRSPNQ
jgi:hypothetical protein